METQTIIAADDGINDQTITMIEPKQMRETAQKQFDAGCDIPDVTLKVDFVNLLDTEEYRQYQLLQNIYLGDGVTVIAKRLGISVRMRMTQYTYDCLTGKYTSMVLGSAGEALSGNMITGRQLPSGVITASKLSGNSVSSRHLQAESVRADHIAADAITTEKLAAGVIMAQKLAAGVVDAQALSAVTARIGALTAGSIETDQLAAALAAFQIITAGSAAFDAATVRHLPVNGLAVGRFSERVSAAGFMPL